MQVCEAARYSFAWLHEIEHLEAFNTPHEAKYAVVFSCESMEPRLNALLIAFAMLRFVCLCTGETGGGRVTTIDLALKVTPARMVYGVIFFDDSLTPAFRRVRERAGDPDDRFHTELMDGGVPVSTWNVECAFFGRGGVVAHMAALLDLARYGVLVTLLWVRSLTYRRDSLGSVDFLPLPT